MTLIYMSVTQTADIHVRSRGECETSLLGYLTSFFLRQSGSLLLHDGNISATPFTFCRSINTSEVDPYLACRFSSIFELRA